MCYMLISNYTRDYCIKIEFCCILCSLRTMFQRSHLAETFMYFQQLLQEGVFDSSVSGMDEECRTLKRLVLHNLSRSKWVEHHKKLKVWMVIVIQCVWYFTLGTVNGDHHATSVVLYTLVEQLTLYFWACSCPLSSCNELNLSLALL